MSDVFISYSREDKAFVSQLREAFLQKSKVVWIDWESIPASQSWWHEIKRGIATANNFVVVMSLNSMSSPICHLEIEYARSLGKRIIPVLHLKPDRETCLIGITKRLANPDSSQDITRDLWGNRQSHTIYDENQKSLAPINYFFFEPTDNFDDKFERLLDIIQTDFDHKEIHTRIGLRASQWASRDRDISFLLIGEELKDAENWMNEAVANAKKQPPVTDLQAEYIRTGRAEEDKRARQLRAIRRARLVASVLAGMMLLFAIGASIIGANATNQALIAQNDVATSNAQLATATSEQGNVLATATQILATGTAVVNRLNDAEANLETVNQQVAQANNQLATATAVAQNLADAEATLEVVNQQVVVAQATVTQAAIINDISNSFASALLQNQDNPQNQIYEVNDIIEKYPDEADAYISRGLIYQVINSDYDQAISDYTQAITLNPESVRAYNNRGAAYINLGEYEKAIEDYDEILQLNHEYVEAYSNRGAAYINLGEYEKAIEDYNEALRLNPEFIEARYNRGVAYANLREYEKAIEDYNEALRLNPEFIEAHYNCGNAYANLGEYEKAIDNYDEVLRLNPEFVIAYYNRGIASYNLGQYERAIADYDEAIRLNPEYAFAYNNRGISYFFLFQQVTETANEETQLLYLRNVVLDFRMAESLGVELSQQIKDLIAQIEVVIGPVMPTPTP